MQQPVSPMNEAELARREVLTWLARELRWETRLDELRRPGGGRPIRRRRARPDDTGLRRAG